MVVRWLDEALDDLDALADFIASDNPAAAGLILARIIRAADDLAAFPRRGRLGRRRGTRELVITGTPWLIACRITPDAIEMLRVLHGRQRRPAQIHPD